MFNNNGQVGARPDFSQGQQTPTLNEDLNSLFNSASPIESYFQNYGQPQQPTNPYAPTRQESQQPQVQQPQQPGQAPVTYETLSQQVNTLKQEADELNRKQANPKQNYANADGSLNREAYNADQSRLFTINMEIGNLNVERQAALYKQQEQQVKPQGIDQGTLNREAQQVLGFMINNYKELQQRGQNVLPIEVMNRVNKEYAAMFSGRQTDGYFNDPKFIDPNQRAHTLHALYQASIGKVINDIMFGQQNPNNNFGQMQTPYQDTYGSPMMGQSPAPNMNQPNMPYMQPNTVGQTLAQNFLTGGITKGKSIADIKRERLGQQVQQQEQQVQQYAQQYSNNLPPNQRQQAAPQQTMAAQYAAYLAESQRRVGESAQAQAGYNPFNLGGNPNGRRY